jgi:hypothetical protein
LVGTALAHPRLAGEGSAGGLKRGIRQGEGDVLVVVFEAHEHASLKVDEAWLARVRDLFDVVVGVPYPWFYRRGVKTRLKFETIVGSHLRPFAAMIF